MKTIKTKYGMPILDIVKGISAGKQVDFGVVRDKFPDRDWGEVKEVNLEFGQGLRDTEFTEELRIKLLVDLAYVYGLNSNKFEQKLKEFEL